MGVFAAVRAYAIRPYIFTVYSLGIRSLLASFRFSPTTVGTYRIRPHVSEDEMIAVNKASSFNGRVAAVRAYAIRPYIIYHLFVGDSFFVGVVPFCFSLATVGAYRICPSCE